MARLALAVCLCACAVAAATAAPPARAARACGVFSARTTIYRTEVLAGRVACARARAVLATFTRSGRSPRGWICFRGHTSQRQRWAATCSSRDGKRQARSWLVKSIKP